MLKSTILFLVVSLLGCTRAACPLTGDLVVPHEGDTTKDVVCREGTERILSCDDGTTYNPLIKRCETSRYWSERAPTCLFNQTETLYFPHETSCSMFYTCAHGVTNIETCPEGLEYNPDIWACDWPSPNGCFAHTTTPPPTEPTTESITEPTDSPTEPTDSPTEPTDSPTDPTPTDPPVKCLVNGTELPFIPHPTDCAKFYICWEGKPTLMECYFDYEFDIATGECVLISDSGCTASKTSTLIWSTSTESSSSFTDDSSPTTDEPDTTTDPTPTVNCPTSGTGVTFLPHPTICNMFYMCFVGIPVKLECDFGDEFDVEVGDCVPISDSGCTALKTSTLIWLMSTESSSSFTDDSSPASDEPDSKA